MNLYQLFLGQIPEALYFALFIILVKQLKEKRIIFSIIMIIGYLILKYLLPFNIWFHITYTFITFITLKLLYKHKSQITDIFLFTIASIILVLISAVTIPIAMKDALIGIILNRVILMIFLLTSKNELPNIQNLYKKLWNRSDKPKKIKSITFRGLNLVVFNILFYLINILIIYELFIRR